MISYGQITVSGIEDGYNRAVVQLYMRSSATSVSAPTTHPVYTFYNGSLSFVPTGWSLTVPTTDGNPCWVTSTTVTSQDATCTIDSWTTPVKLVEDGTPGAAATAYHLIVSSPVVVKNKAGSYNVTSITLNAKAQTGSSAMGDYSGRFKIETTANGTSWSSKYSSSSNQTSYTYTIPSDITAIRCSLYLAGGLTTLLDQQIVPIVTDGSDGVTITSKSVTYQKGTSGTTAPTGTWQTAVPTVGEGEYLWTKTTVAYSDGTSTEAYSVSRMGTNGANGDSVTITSTEITYQISSSGTVTPTGTWQDTIPSMSPGNYLWTRTIVNYSDGTSTTSYGVSRSGVDGDDAYTVVLTNESHQFQGDTTKAVAASTTIGVIAYKGATQVNTSITNNAITGKPTGMTTTVNNNNSTSTTITVSVTTSMTTTHGTLTIPIVVDGKTFNKVFTYSLQLAPQPGNDATAYHLIVSNAAIVKTKSGAYSPTTITLNAKSQTGTSAMGDYPGRFKIETTANGSTWTQTYPSSGTGSNQSSYTYTIPSGITAIRCSLYLAGGLTTLLDQQVVPVVTDGTDVTISSKSVTYQKGTSGTTAPTGTWQTSIPSVGEGEYLWTKTVVTYSDGTSTEAYSVSRMGTNGDSVTITSTEVAYQTSTSGTTTPTGTWQTSVPSVTAGQYLWTRTTVTYSDGKSTTSYSVSRYGTDGDPAYTVILTNESHQFAGDTTKAVAGSTTIGVIAYKGATQVATSVTNNSIVTKPTGMTTTVNNNNSTSTTITVSVTTSMVTKNGTLTIPIVVDGKTFNKIFSYSLQLAPEKGEAASSVYMNVSAAAVARSELGAYNPTAITMEAMVQTGVSDPLATTGFFKVETSDGTTWIQRYASSTAESFYSYTNLPTGITSIRISLYKESEMTTLYDQTVIPIVNEGYTITAQQAINRATAIYGVCSTSATSADKEVTISNFEAYNGAQITVLFTHEHQAGNPTLNVIGTQTVGAKPIYATSKDGTLTRLAANNPPTSVEERGWIENSLVNFVYDNTNSRWIIVDSSALQKIDNILTKVIAGDYGEINMTNGTFAFTGTNGSIAYANGDLNLTGKINALEGGTIGGFTIGSSSIFKDMSSIIDGTHDGVYLGTDGIALGKGSFKVLKDGTLTATNATITGEINASSGEIGGFIIDSTSIRSAAKSAVTDGAIALSSNTFARTINGTSRSDLHFAIGKNFGVKNDGTVYAGGVNISGTIDATGGSISGDMTVTGTLKGASVNVQTTDNSSTTAGFSVLDKSGNSVFAVRPNAPTTSGFSYKGRFDGNLYIDGTAYATGALATAQTRTQSLLVESSVIGSATPTVYARIDSTGAYSNGVQISPYSVNQTVTLVSGQTDFAAHITTSSTDVVIGVPTGLSMENISNIEITSFSLTLRHVGGGYPYHGTTQISNRTSLPSGLTMTATKAGPYMIRIILSSTTGFVTTSGGSTKVTNNTPIAASFSDLKVKFT